MKNKEQQETSSNQYMTVKTTYARVAMLLLALNFCLTGYCVLSLTKSQQEQIDAIGSTTQGTQTLNSRSDNRATTPATLETREE